MEVPCVNCKKSFPTSEGMWWEKLFLCPSCYKLADRTYKRGEARLKWMLALLKEAVKAAIMKGELALPAETEETSDSFLLHLKKLVEATKAQKKVLEKRNASHANQS